MTKSQRPTLEALAEHGISADVARDLLALLEADPLALLLELIRLRQSNRRGGRKPKPATHPDAMLVAQARTALGVTTVELAQRIGVRTRSQLSRYPLAAGHREALQALVAGAASASSAPTGVRARAWPVKASPIRLTKPPSHIVNDVDDVQRRRDPSPMPPKDCVALRIDPALRARVEALRPRYGIPGREATLSDALRALLIAGVERVEGDERAAAAERSADRL